MGSHERWTALLDTLGKNGQLEVTVAATALGVSVATIRRDLDHLAAQQLLTRTRGGAAPASVAYDLPLRHKSSRFAQQKLRIGTAAAALIPAGAVVGLNGGTTTSQVARALVTRAPVVPATVDSDPDSGPDDGIIFTVVTNALNIANDLAVRRSVKLVVTGGVARPRSYELLGPLAEPTLVRVHLDYAVVGVDGFDLEVGATADHEGEAAVTAHMVARASHVILVADSSKLGRASFARVCTAAAVGTLVTDSDADPALLDAMRAEGITVIVA
ncbi:MAG: DeoR/GlpR family DNA-binding transcription regulator [Nakamurella sp.]